jgi:hypothetical protein
MPEILPDLTIRTPCVRMEGYSLAYLTVAVFSLLSRISGKKQ